jgi:hypothetical protein
MTGNGTALMQIRKPNLKRTADEVETNLDLSFGVLGLMRIDQRCKKPKHTKLTFSAQRSVFLVYFFLTIPN